MNFPRRPTGPFIPRIERPRIDIEPEIPTINFPPAEPIKQPLILFPLKLEMRSIHENNQQKYYFRWYPDEIALKISEQKISIEEMKLFSQLLYEYRKLKTVSISSYPAINADFLKKYNRLIPQKYGELTDDLQEQCEAYNRFAMDEIQKLYKKDKKEGLKREGFGLYDFDNPYIHNLWQPLLQRIGEGRASYVVNQFHQDPESFKQGLSTIDEHEIQSTFKDVFNQGVEVCFLPKKLSLFACRFTNSVSSTHFDFQENVQLDLIQEVQVESPLYIQLDEKELKNKLDGDWLYNFDMAVKKGMGVIVKDQIAVRKVQTADWLIVTGHEYQSNDEMQKLFESHLSHGKLSFSTQDSPTNNTAKKTSSLQDEEKNLLRRAPLQFDSSYHLEYDSQKFAKIANLPASFFSNVLNADQKEQLDAATMAEMMWEVTTYLAKESGEYGSDLDAWEQLKQFYIDYVRARGHFPILNFDDTPYGILPITDIYKSEFKGEQKKLLNEVKSINLKLIEQQKSAFAQTPKLDKRNPYESFLRILQHQAVSGSMRAKKCRHFSPIEDAYPVKGPLVEDRPWNYLIDPSYIKGLEYLTCTAKGSVKVLSTEMRKELAQIVIGPEGLPQDMRHYVEETEGEMRRVLYKDSKGNTHLILAPIDIAFIERHIKDKKQKPKISLLHKLLSYFIYRGGTNQIEDNLLILRPQAEYLQKLTRSKLEMLMMECADLLSFRADAWIVALSYQKLFSLSDKSFYKPGFGCFGWLEKPGLVSSRSLESEYLQAPSNEQSITAALLRSGCRSQQAGLKPGESFSINLNSKRVRKATAYLDALRQGHHPNEILGYELEKRLKEAQIDRKTLFELREKYPFNNDKSLPIVIDGEAVLANEASLPSEVKTHISELKQMKDSLADLILSESLYQVVRGNHERLGAWLNVLSGDTTAPELQSMQNPRQGEYRDIKIYLPVYQFEERESFTDLLDPCLSHFAQKTLPDSSFFDYQIQINFHEIEFTVGLNLQDELGFQAYDILLHEESSIHLLIKWLVLSMARIEDARFAPLFQDKRFKLDQFKTLWQELNIEISQEASAESQIQNVKNMLFQGDKLFLNSHVLHESSYKPSLVQGRIDLEDGYAKMKQRFEELKESEALDDIFQIGSIEEILSSYRNILSLSQFNLLLPVTNQIISGSSAGINSIIDAHFTQRLKTIQKENLSTSSQMGSRIQRLAKDFCLLIGKKRTSFIFMGASSRPLPSPSSGDSSMARLLAYSQVHPRLHHALETLSSAVSVRKIIQGQDQVLAEEYYLRTPSDGSKPDGYIEVDRWEDFIPKVNPGEGKMTQTTPVTVHYPTPRSQAANAILIATPPDTDDFYLWTDEKVATCLSHTLILMQARMSSSNVFSDHFILGQFLPLLHTFNPYGKDYYESYKNDFLSLGSQAGTFTFVNDPSKKELVKSLSADLAKREEEES